MATDPIVPADDPGLDLTIRASAIDDFFVCPICFSPLTDCHITPCGHNFCLECITEWISRAHSCPTCNATDGMEVGRLVKNLAFDNLLQTVTAERQRAAKLYFHALSGDSAATPHAGSAAAALSPIEAVAAKHMQRALGAYKSYFAGLDATRLRREEVVVTSYAGRVAAVRAQHKAAQRLVATGPDELPTAPPDLSRTASVAAAEDAFRAAAAWRDGQIAEIRAQHDKQVAILVSEYDAFLSSSLPEPSLIPTTATLHVPCHGWRFDVKVGPTLFLRDLRDAVTSRAAGMGDPVTSFGDDCTWVLLSVAGGGAGDVPGAGAGAGGDVPSGGQLLSEVSPVFSQVPGGRLPPSAEIELRGSVVLASDKPARCFSTEFVKGSGQRVDYWTCVDCKINWVCQTCADVCHKTHSLRPYIKDHKPSFACCYCAKKKLCTLVT